MAEKKSWRDYSKSYSEDETAKKSAGNAKTGTWRDHISNQSGNDGKAFGSWRAYSTFDPMSAASSYVTERLSGLQATLNKNASDYIERYSGRTYTYDDVYVGDSASWLDAATKQKNQIDLEMGEIIAYMQKNGDYIDADWANSVRKTLERWQDQQEKLLVTASQDNEWWRQFDDADMVKEHGSAEGVYNYYKRAKGYYDEYGGLSPDGIEEILVTLPDGEEKEWLEAYKWGQFLSAPDFEEYAKKGAAIENPTVGEAEGWVNIFGWRPGAEEVGNIVTYSRDNYDKIVNNSEGGKYDVVGDFRYIHMTDKEVDLYNYLLAKHGKTLADAFLDVLTDTLNARQGGATAELLMGIDIPVLEELAIGVFGIGAGLDQWASGVKQFFSSDVLPTTDTQYANAAIADSLDGLDKDVYQATNVVGNMLPSILITKGVGALGAGATAAKVAGATSVSIGAAGNAYKDGIEEYGMEKWQARTYSTMVGAAEGALDYAIGGIPALRGTEDLVSAKIKMIDNALLRVGTKIGWDVLEEITEEELQNFLEPAFRAIFTGEYDAPTVEELIETAIVTALSTPAMGAVGTVREDVQENRNYVQSGESIMESPGGVDSLMDLSNEVYDVSDSKFQREISKAQNRVTSKQNARRVGMLYDTVSEAHTEYAGKANKADIMKSLTRGESGLTTSEASSIAEALVAQANGQELTKKQAKILENYKDNAKVQNALNNIVRNKNSTVSQRNQVMSNFVNELRKLLEGDTAAEKVSEDTAVGEIAEASEGVSEGNVTRLKSTGEAVTVQKVASVKNGKMTLQLEDGRKVDAGDIEYSSADEAVVYETVASLATNAAAANLMLSTYEGSGVPAQVFAKGMEEAYRYGSVGMPAEQMLDRGSFLDDLTDYQLNTGYELGKMFGGRKIAKEQGKTVAKTDTGSKVKAVRKKGRVKGYGVKMKDLGKAFNTAQEQAYRILCQIAEVTGIDIVLFQSKPDANGNLRGGIIDGIDMNDSQGAFSWKNNKIYIDINAGVLKASDLGDVAKYSMLRTFSHEFTHFLEKHDAQQYNVFREIVFDVMRRNGVDPDSLIEDYMKQHKGTTRDAASREVVAEAMTDILPESSFMEQLVHRHKGLAEKLLESLKEFVAEIKAHFKSMGGNQSKEAAAVKDYMGDAIKYAEGLAEAFDRLAVSAVENYQAAIVNNGAEQEAPAVARQHRKVNVDRASDLSDLVYRQHQPGQDLLEFDHNQWAKKKTEATQKYGLTQDESDGIDSYVGGRAYYWNAIMRRDSNYERTEFDDFWINQAINGFNKFPKFNGRTYRNLSFANQESLNLFMEEHKTGENADVDYFLSSSKDPNGYSVSGDYVAHMVIDGFSGRDISESFSIPGQREVVYLPGTKLHIVSVTTANDGNPLIYVQEVKENGKDLETNSGGYEQGSAGANKERQTGDAGRKGNDLGGVHQHRGMERDGEAVDGVQIQHAGHFFQTEEINNISRLEYETDQFKQWFGDWQNNPENASKVVDADGKPMVMYHGTSSYGFSVFDTYGGKFGLFGKGSYFTDNQSVAESYTQKGKGNQQGVYAVYLNIRNPIDMDADADLDAWRKAFKDASLDPSYLDEVVSNEDAFKALKENLQDDGYVRWEAEEVVTGLIEGMGYDGITHIGGGRYNQNDGTRHRVYIAFESEQIKSAMDNAGTYDGNDPDIYHQDRTETLTNRDIIGEIEGKTELERKTLKEYRETLKRARELARTHADLTRQIDELKASKDPKDRKKLSELTVNAAKTRNRRDIREKQLREMEDGLLAPLIRREKGAVLEKLRNIYGTIPKGEKAVRDDSLPVSVDGKTKVSRTARTVKGAGVTPGDFAELIDTEVVKGGLSYIPISNDEATQRAVEWIKNEGWEAAFEEWHDDVLSYKTGADMFARGALLLNNAANVGDKKVWLNILYDYQLLNTYTGQGMQAARILKQLQPEDKLYMIRRSIKQMVKDMRLKVDIQLDEQLVKRYEEAQTEEERDALYSQIQQSVADQIPSTFMDKWTALRYVNMLGNPRTQVRNFFGNLMMMGTTRLKDVVATGLEQIAYKASGGKFERSKSFINDRELLKAAKADFGEVEALVLGDGKYSAKMAQSTEFIKGVMDKRKIFKRKWREKYRTATNSIMEKGDVIFSRAAYAHALANYLQAHGVEGGDLSVVNQMLLDEARLYAIQQAQEATFRDTSALSGWISTLGRKRTTHFAGRLLSEGVMPFRKTPANMLIRAEEYSPLGILNSVAVSIHSAIGHTDLVNRDGIIGDIAKAGEQITGSQIVESWAKSLTGTGLFFLGMLLYNAGWLIGGPDDDESEDKFDSLNGWQNYSFRIPGTDINVTVDFLSPSVVPMFMGAQMMELIQEDGFQFKDLESALTSIVEPMVEMSMLQGVNDTLENVQYSENNLLQIGISASLSYLTQGLINSWLGQLERGFEDQRMTTYVDKDSAMPAWLQQSIGKASAKIPGWDYQQTPYINAWGEEEQNPHVLLNTIYNMLSPSYVSQGQEDAVSQELMRLHEVNEAERSVLPSTPKKTIDSFTDSSGVKHTDYNLSADEYVALAKAQGQTQRQIVEGMVGSELYEGLPDKYKVKAVHFAYDYARESAQIQVINRDGFGSKWMAEIEGDTAEGILNHVIAENIEDMYLEGHITADEAIKRRMEYHGDTAEKAAGKIAYWDFKAQKADVHVDDDWFETYYKKVESSGIDIDTYVAYRNQMRGLEKRDEILKVIDAQPISKKQKDALYFAEGYAKSTLHKAPWH